MLKLKANGPDHQIMVFPHTLIFLFFGHATGNIAANKMFEPTTVAFSRTYSAARREDFALILQEMGQLCKIFDNRQKYIYWLSLGPSIVRLLKQWKQFCHFVAELPQEEKTNLKHINLRTNGCFTFEY